MIQRILPFAAALIFSCSQTPPLKAVKATRSLVESTVTTTSTGTVTAQQSAVLGFGTSGRVVRILVKVGERVAEGQVLATLENVELQTAFENAEKELRRNRELFAAGLVSRAALDDALKNRDVSRASLDRTVIKAPFAGLVTEVNLEVGETAQTTSQAGKAPIRLVDLKPRIVKGNIDEIDLAKVKVGTPARVKVPAVGPRLLKAQVQRVVPYVSTAKEQDRTSEIEIQIIEPHPVLIPAGASAEIEIITASKADALALPTRVLLGHGEGRYAFRYSEGRLARAPVKTGVGNYLKTEIISGLGEGDTVVFPPDEYELQDGMRVKVDVVPWP